LTVENFKPVIFEKLSCSVQRRTD